MNTLKWLLFSLVCLGPAAFGQSTFGGIEGTVRDASGAVVEGAKVTLTELETSTVATTASSPAGLYDFLNVQPGRYQVSVEKAGFATARTPEILLDARQTRRAEFQLEVAPRTDIAVVTARVPNINTESGTISDSKDWEQITRLPLSHS